LVPSPWFQPVKKARTFLVRNCLEQMGWAFPNDVVWVIDIEFFRFGYDEK